MIRRLQSWEGFLLAILLAIIHVGEVGHVGFSLMAARFTT